MCWAIVSPFVYIAKRLSLSRENYLHSKIDDEHIATCQKIFAEQQIKNGLFKGLQFNNIEATGSSIYAKLLGSYEMELMPVLKGLLQKKYDYFVNVGCDEGYYAVGIAKVLPVVKVIAFDCYKPAQERCKSLAILNGVAERITVNGCFTINELEVIKSQNKVLFIIDCEGCEDDVIDERLITQFPASDFIIELHYEKVPEILPKLQTIFKATHNVSIVKALSDHEKVMQYDFPEIGNLSYQQKYFILEERESYTEWLVATAVK